MRVRLIKIQCVCFEINVSVETDFKCYRYGSQTRERRGKEECFALWEVKQLRKLKMKRGG